MNISLPPAVPAKRPISNPSYKPVSTPRFAGNSAPENLIELAKKKFPSGVTSPSALEHAIKNGLPIPLRNGGQVLYGSIHKNAQGQYEVKTSFEKARKLINPGLNSISHLSTSEAFFFIEESKSPETHQALQRIVSELIPTHLQGSPATKPHKDQLQPESGQIIYSDLIEKLISGQSSLLAKGLKTDLDDALKGKSIEITSQSGSPKTLNFSDMSGFYKIITPNNPDLQKKLNDKSTPFRSQLLGLELARKIYSEGQEVEWKSVALSLGLGAVGEPTIHALFKDGGTAATVARSGLMSGIDIMGNILSVMGMVKEKHKSLSMETIFGPKGQRSYLNPAGKAGPDIKDGAKHGFLYGLGIGVPFNIPAGGILSLPNAGVLPRSVIGGLSGIGSAVAIPPAVKKDLNVFIANIKQLEAAGKLKKPPEENLDKWARKLALKEMNTRLGYASSIKATHPLPLVGTGAAILGAEKLGIPREYVQTAFMCLAPVMNNFLRLVFTGTEKFHTIPQRMKKLESLMMESNAKGATPEKTQKEMDKALSGSGLFSSWYTEKLANTALIACMGAVLLTAEVLYYLQTKKKSEQGEIDKEAIKTHPQPQLHLKPTHSHMEFGDKVQQPSNPFGNWPSITPQASWPNPSVSWTNYTPLNQSLYNAQPYRPQPLLQPAYQPPASPMPFPYQVGNLAFTRQQ
jgi:hypothetical protein